MSSTIFITSFFVRGHGFNILIQKYISEEWDQIFQFSLKCKTTETSSAESKFSLNLYESIFIISSFSWFKKVDHLLGDTARKVSVFGIILVHNFPHSDWIQTRITSNTDTFYVVGEYVSMLLLTRHECGIN